MWLVVGLLLVFGAQADDNLANLAIGEPKGQEEADFMTWLGHSGVLVRNLDLANFTNPVFSNYKLRGVKATSDIKAGDELLQVPGELIISTITALDSPVGVIFKENPQLFTDDQLILTIFLMHELQNEESSKWFYHLKILPTRFHTACEYAHAELRQLEGSVLYDEATTRQQLFLDEFNALFPNLAQRYPHLLDLNKSSFTAYKYARLLVQTRAFGMHVDERVIIGIAPFGDMFNHNPQAKTAWKYDHSTNVFHMYTEQPYTIGTQVFNNYGPRSNRRLLLDFGFVIQDNPFDFVEVPAPISTGNSGQKAQALQDLGVDPSKRAYTVRLGEVPDDLMMAVRLARATNDEIREYQRSVQLSGAKLPSTGPSKVVPSFNASIGLRNEIASLSWLQDVASTMLSKYRETYEDDTQLLSHAQVLDRGQLNSLIVRHAEKRIFKFLSEFAQVHIPLLTFYKKYQSGNSLSNARISLSGAEYMRNVLLPLQRSLLESAYKSNPAATPTNPRTSALALQA